MSGEADIRRIACDDAIPVSILRDFILQALRHDALRDELLERMVLRADRGELNAHGLSALLPELIGDVLNVATNEDWTAIAELLIEAAEEAREEGGEQG